MHNVKNEMDPVCGMLVEATEFAEQTMYNQRTYYFCSTGCKDKFDSDPAEFEFEPSSRPIGRTKSLDEQLRPN